MFLPGKSFGLVLATQLILTATPIGLITTLDRNSLVQTTAGINTGTVATGLAAGNGKVWATFDADNTIRQYSNGVEEVRMNPFFHGFRDLTFGDSALSAVREGFYGSANGIEVNIFNIVSNGYTWSLTAPTGALAADIAAGGGLIWATFADGTISQYNRTTGALQVNLNWFFHAFRDLTYGDGRLSAVREGRYGLPNGIDVGIYNIVSNGYSYQRTISTGGLATHIAAGNNSIYAAFDGGTLSRYDAATGILLATVTYQGYQWNGLAYSDGVLYASAAVAEVPEPASMALLFAGVLAVVAIVRVRASGGAAS